MTLTPADVRAVSFRASRLRAGYDMDEVDEFLDAVQETIGHLGVDVARYREAESVLLVRCEQLQARIALLEQQDRASASAAQMQRPSEIEASLAARCEALQTRVIALEHELAVANRTANQLAAAEGSATRLTQVLATGSSEVESALKARCEALQAQVALLETELSAANRASQEQVARRVAAEDLAAAQKATIDMAASSALAQAERSKEVESALTARCEALQARISLLERHGPAVEPADVLGAAQATADELMRAAAEYAAAIRASAVATPRDEDS
jgi:DivIVA domain-containing protein